MKKTNDRSETRSRRPARGQDDAAKDRRVGRRPSGGGGKAAGSSAKNGRSAASAKSAGGKATRNAENGVRAKRHGRIHLHVRDLVGELRTSELRELYQFWGGASESLPQETEDARRRLESWLCDPVRIETRIGSLGPKLQSVINALIEAPHYQLPFDELLHSRSLARLNEYDLEACLSALAHRGIVGESDDARFERFGERVVALPEELAEGLLGRRRERSHGIFGVLTLRGHMDMMDSAGKHTPQRLRELYKMYSQESAIVARIERLPEGVRGLVEKAILEFGGVLSRTLFERMETDLPHWNGRRWRMILEQSLIGTAQEVDLTSYGIQLKDEALIVFNEVALAWLRRVAVPGDPDRPHEELSLGIDLASNVSRFLDYIGENDVRYTVRGEIFETTEKRILQHLIANPGRELAREDVLSFVFRFARQSGLIDRTGKRTFAVTAKGRAWGGNELVKKREELLEFALTDRRLGGEPFHQVRMREIFLRLLKRVEPGVWYDLMYLPFLARNTYLATLDDLCVRDHFTEGTHNGRMPAMEDPQRLAWNLASWVRQRLYLLGLIELGYDADQRPVALRLTPGGARALGMESQRNGTAKRVGSLVVTPDFEVVLFPTGDDSQLIHDLDRFAVREKLDSLLHFRLTEESIRRGLRDGMALAACLETLDHHSRTPVPQNVRFSIRDWAARAGLMRLTRDLRLSCEDADVLRRFQQDPGARNYIARSLDGNTMQLRGASTPKRMQALLRELDFLVELAEE